LTEFGALTGLEPLIEVGLSFKVEGIRYRGFADMLWTAPWCRECGTAVFKTKKGHACTNGHMDPEIWKVPVVADHKTSSSPEKWGLTSRTLPRDPQALIYANFGLEWTGADLADLQWTYLRTRGRVEAVPIRSTLTRDEARKNFLDHVHPHGIKIMNMVRAMERGELTRADQLEPNPRACGAFGGCPQASYCPRSPDAIMTSIFGVKKETETMNLKEKLAKKHGSKTDKKGKSKKDKGKKADVEKPKKGKKAEKAEPVRPAAAPKKKDKGKSSKKEKVESKGRTINSPEAPKDPAIAREISERVGQVAGNKKTRPANARTIAEAAVGAVSAEDAAARCQAALVRLGKDKVTPKDMVLIQIASGLDLFAPTKPRAAELGLVFAAGRTIMALKRDEAIEVEKVEWEDGGDVYRVSLLEAGRTRVAELDPELAISGIAGAMAQAEPEPKGKGKSSKKEKAGKASTPSFDFEKLARGIATALQDAFEG